MGYTQLDTAAPTTPREERPRAGSTGGSVDLIEIMPLRHSVNDCCVETAVDIGTSHTSGESQAVSGSVAWALNCLALVHTFLTAGIVFGVSRAV